MALGGSRAKDNNSGQKARQGGPWDGRTREQGVCIRLEGAESVPHEPCFFIFFSHGQSTESVIIIWVCIQ